MARIVMKDIAIVMIIAVVNSGYLTDDYMRILETLLNHAFLASTVCKSFPSTLSATENLAQADSTLSPHCTFIAFV